MCIPWMRTECQDGNTRKPFAGYRDLARAVTEGSNGQREKKAKVILRSRGVTVCEREWHRKRLYLFSCTYQLKPKCSQALKIPGLAKVHSIPNAISSSWDLLSGCIGWTHLSLSGVDTSCPSNLTIPPGIFSVLSSSIKYVNSPPLHSLTQLTRTFKRIKSLAIHFVSFLLSHFLHVDLKYVFSSSA